MKLSLKKLPKRIVELLPYKQTNKTSPNNPIVSGTGGKTNYRILPNLRIAYAMPIALFAAGIGTYAVFFSQAATTCTQTLSSGVTPTAIQSTIENAANGAVICLPSSPTSYGDLSINKKRTGYVTLQSTTNRGATLGNINLSQSSEYFRFESLKLGSINAKYNITSGTSTSNIQIVDNDLSGAGSYSANQYWLIEGNYFHDCGHCIEFSTSDSYMPSQHIVIKGNKFMGPNDEDMIRIANFRDVLIENNEFINNFEHTVPLSQSSDGVCHCDAVQAVWGGSDLVFRNNKILNGTGQGFFVKDARITSTVGQFGLGTYQNITVENNLIVNNKKDSDSPAPQFSWGSAALTPIGINGPADNVKIFNNTVWDNDGATSISESVTNVIVKNNIFNRFYASDGVTITNYDYNISPNVFVSTKENPPNSGIRVPTAWINQGSNNISGSPTFAYASNSTDLNQANWNYKLASTSNGIDKGTNTSGVAGYTVPITDIEGNIRVDTPNVTNGASGFFDMGAYEYGANPSGGGLSANIWVDLRGNDTGSNCVRTVAKANPDTSGTTLCKSINSAWEKALAGDTIRLIAGTYNSPAVSDKIINTIPQRKSSETYIIGENGTKFSGSFNPQGYYMTLENVIIDVGSTHGSSINVGGQHITFKDVSLYGNTVGMSVNGDYFTWKDGSFGEDGVLAAKRHCQGSNGQSVGDAEPITINGDNATIDGIRFNPQKADIDNANPTAGCPDGNFHLEDIRIEGALNATIKNTWFLPGSEAGSGHIFVTNWQSSATAASGLKLINNIFEPVNGSYSIQVHNNVQNCGWLFAYNTFYQDVLTQCNYSTSNWVGNLSAYYGCKGNQIKNVYYSSNTFTCGSNTRVNGTSMSSLGVGTGGRLNAGSPAINAAETDGDDDYCTNSDVASRDFEKTVRPQGSACDAGAYEYTGSTGGTDTNLPTTTISATTPSVLLTQSPVPSTTSTTASITFSGTDNIAVTSYECSLDSTTTYSACTSPKSYGTPTALSTGSHTFRVRAKDAAGNTDATPASITWTITGTTTTKPGDLNNDNSVNTTDLVILLSKFGTADPNANLNSQGNVDTTDLIILLSKFGS